MQPNLNACEIAWDHPHLPLNEQPHLLQLPPIPCLYRRFTYPEPPASTLGYFPSITRPVPNYVASVDFTPGMQQNRQKEQQSQVLIERQSKQQIHRQTQQQPQAKEQSILPKLTIEMLKCHIKPADRSTNHEFSLPGELEPYLGKGWMCRYYHSTPAWGFIPPKGSGIRRADGFKALMARFELLQYRKRIAEETSQDANEEVSDEQELSSLRKGRKADPEDSNIMFSSGINLNAIPSTFSRDHDTLMRSNQPEVTNRNLSSYEYQPEPYNAYSIYFRLEHMRLLQENDDIDLRFQSSINGIFYDPLEHPRPEKYKHCVLPPYWYSSAHREVVGSIMKRLCKGNWTSTIDAASETISASWCSESSEVHNYCQRLAQVEKTRCDHGMCSGSLKRTSKASLGEESTGLGSGEKETSAKKPRLASTSTEKSTKGEEIKRQVEKSSLKETELFCLSDFDVTKYTADNQVQKDAKATHDIYIQHTFTDVAIEELPHHVTFESSGSQEEGTPTTTLNHLSTGIGLLAHVASLLG